MQWSPLNVLLQLLFGGGLALGLVALLVSYRKGARARRVVAAGLTGWVVLYLAAVLAVSLASRETVLPPGTPKHFCGFYLDCHMSVAVRNVSRARTVGTAGSEHTARGTYYLVTVAVASDARQATLRLIHPGVYVVDDRGRRFPAVPPSEIGGDPASTAAQALSQRVPAGAWYPTVLVFDLPADVTHPRLLVTESQGLWPDRLLELFLIGDEDSVLHGKTTLSLASPGPSA